MGMGFTDVMCVPKACPWIKLDGSPWPLLTLLYLRLVSDFPPQGHVVGHLHVQLSLASAPASGSDTAITVKPLGIKALYDVKCGEVAVR